MKTVIQIVLWIGCIALGYFIYNSITGPIKFKEVKEAYDYLSTSHGLKNKIHIV